MVSEKGIIEVGGCKGKVWKTQVYQFNNLEHFNMWLQFILWLSIIIPVSVTFQSCSDDASDSTISTSTSMPESGQFCSTRFVLYVSNPKRDCAAVILPRKFWNWLFKVCVFSCLQFNFTCDLKLATGTSWGETWRKVYKLYDELFTVHFIFLSDWLRCHQWLRLTEIWITIV